MFLSAHDKTYLFIYSIIEHSQNPTNDPAERSSISKIDDSNNTYSYNIFLKMRGKMHPIWNYHKFNDKTIKKFVKDESRFTSSLDSHFKEVCKRIADSVLKDAKEHMLAIYTGDEETQKEKFK